MISGIQVAIALFMNVFLLPGSGQFFLGFKKRGAIIAAITALILMVFIFHMTGVVVGQIPKEPVAVEDLVQFYDFSQSIGNQALVKNQNLFQGYMAVLGMFYLFAACDVFWLYFAQFRE